MNCPREWGDADGMDAGAVRKADTAVATFAILGAINWMPKRYRPGGAWSPEQAAERFSLFFLQSVLAPNLIKSALATITCRTRLKRGNQVSQP